MITAPEEMHHEQMTDAIQMQHNLVEVSASLADLTMHSTSPRERDSAVRLFDRERKVHQGLAIAAQRSERGLACTISNRLHLPRQS